MESAITASSYYSLKSLDKALYYVIMIHPPQCNSSDKIKIRSLKKEAEFSV